MSRWGNYFRIALAAVYAYYSGNWAFFAQQVARERNSVVSKRRARRARQDFNDAQVDRLEMIEKDPRLPRGRCYGRVRTAGGVHRPWTTGTYDDKLTLPVSLAGHEIDGIEGWFLFDQAVTLDGSGWVQEAPYSRTRRVYEGVGRVGDGTVTLPADYVPGTVVASYYEASPRYEQTVSVSVAGLVATVSGSPAGADVTVGYQRDVGEKFVRIRAYLGTASQNIGAALAAEYPGKITATDKAAGVAMAIMDCIYEPDVFPQGRPNLTALFRGAKVYDPRLDSTVAGGSGAHRINDPTTWAWSQNPALIAYDWARYRWGMNVPADEINQADVIAAANACDVSTVFTLRKSPSVTETVTLPRFRCDMVIALGSDPEDVMDRIVGCMGGRWCWAGGVLRLRAGVLNATVASIDKTWLVEGVDDNGQPDGEAVIQAAQGISRDQRYNRVSGSCIDPDKRYQLLPYPSVEDAVLIAAKGEREVEVDFEGVSHIAHAQHLASMLIRQSQAGGKVEMRLGLRGLGLELLDVFSLTYNDRHGITGKTYEVVGWKFSPTEGVTVVGEEVTAALFTVDAELTGRDPAPDSDLRRPWEVEQLTGLTVTSGAPAVVDSSILTRTVVAWTAANGITIRQGGKVEIQYCLADEVPTAGQDWPSWPEEGANTQAVIPGLQAGRFYVFRARFVQPLPLVRGPWCSVSVLHQVGAPPQVGTGGIAPGSATDVFADETGADTVTIPGTGGTSFKTCATRTYTNATGGAVALQWEAEVTGLHFTSIAALAAPDDFVSASWVLKVNGTPVLSDPFIDSSASATPPGPTTKQSRMVAWQYTLAAGDVAELYLSVGGGTDLNAATISWARTRLRTTVIKR